MAEEGAGRDVSLSSPVLELAMPEGWKVRVDSLFVVDGRHGVLDVDWR